MTRYTVTWWPTAESALLTLWLDAADRQAIANASNLIDRELAVDPDKRGDPLEGGLYVLKTSPLRVVYGVNEDDRRVTVLDVGLLD